MSERTPSRSARARGPCHGLALIDEAEPRHREPLSFAVLPSSRSSSWPH